jgi:hypothetical protein
MCLLRKYNEPAFLQCLRDGDELYESNQAFAAETADDLRDLYKKGASVEELYLKKEEILGKYKEMEGVDCIEV